MSTTSIRKSSKDNNRRRFNDDQIKSLETTFETEARPELRLKQHLANKLGLQPRQVAIWFQNKRARSKSKQIERDYSILKSSYDNLASQFEALRKEHQSLLIQVQRLREMADERDGDENDNKNHVALANSDNAGILLDIDNHEICIPSCSDLNEKVVYLEKEDDILNMAQIAEGSENGCSFESCTFLDTTGSQWWDF